jgi:uncharacterized protein
MMSNIAFKAIAPIAVLTLALTTGAGGSCQSLNPGDQFVKVYFPGGRSVTAELAVTDDQRARGLMFRETLLADQGMLFVFAEEEPHSFWMKNMLIPIDMLWLGSDRRILYIAKDVPPCKADPCPSYGPGTPARFVLELKAGSSEALKLKPGDRLDFVLPAWLNN